LRRHTAGVIVIPDQRTAVDLTSTVTTTTIGG